MSANQIRNVFVEREFEVDGIEGVVKLLIAKPQPDKELDWHCEFQVVGIGDEKVRKIYGVDSIQALLGAVQVANATLESYGRGEHTITWLGGNDLGLHLNRLSSDSKND